VELGGTDMGLMMFESGICTECDAPFEHCMCDPCQHGHGRKDHCIFCQGEQAENKEDCILYNCCSGTVGKAHEVECPHFIEEN